MIKAILLDLDDTLLKNPDAVKVPEYLRLANQFFEDRWGYQDIAEVLKEYVIVLTTGDHDVRQTNTAVAESIIAARVKRPIQEIREAFQEFYLDIYPRLHLCVERIPVAADLFAELEKGDYALVIATNPLYPAEAIYQRLEWAGLPTDPSAYALVTSADNMHFAKPDPAYYAEILARVGVEPDETLMVGDSLTNDIAPAAQLGINTYFVTDAAPPPALDQFGTLADFYELIQQSNWLEQPGQLSLMPQAIEPQLQGNLGALFGLLALAKPQQWTQHPDPNEWSIQEIVCHLLESERHTQRPRLQRILAEDNPFLTPPPDPPGPFDVLSCSGDVIFVAGQFCAERQATIAMLRELSPESWQRPARHSIFGLTTLLEMAYFTAQHDRLHINQLCETLGRCEE